MKPKTPEAFNIRTLDDLRAAAARFGREVPLSRNLALPGQPLLIHALTAPNRLCALPIEGCDADARGAPGELTFRRYRRFAEGGFGMIWLEAAAVADDGCASARQLRLNRSNAGAFAKLVAETREAARLRWKHEIVLILQLSHAGRYSLPGAAPACASPPESAAGATALSDDALDRLQDAYAAAAALALEAGFDGVDIKACYGDLPAELLRAVNRPGRYGGPPENRSRFLREVAGRVAALHPEALTASRIAVAPGAAGAAATANLARDLKQAGVRLLNLAPPDDAAAAAEAGALETFFVLTDALRAVGQAVPELPVVAGGFSWFRHLLPDVAAGVLESCGAAMIGVGRAALANPAMAGELLLTGRTELEKCCIDCNACIQLVRDDGHSGCAVRDREIYAAEYRRHRYYAPDNLRDEARRCRGCEPAPCSSGCPNRIDVPAFLRAFADERIADAYAILRSANAMPGMCSLLCPVNTLCEGPCTAAVLDGRAVPIHDIQHAVCSSALSAGVVGVRLPENDTGKTVAVVGAGPAGISCAVSLLEKGRRVVIFERSSKLGGTPDLLIRSSRFGGAREEIEQLLRPALCAARLSIRYGMELGVNLTLDALRQEHDAVFLATGLWGEHSLGKAQGVTPSLDFLLRAKAGRIRKLSGRVVLLAGGDSAMDCARLCMELGCEELLIVYAGALAEMHWHMEDPWFRTPGVHFLPMTRPVAYRTDSDGKLEALCVEHALAFGADGARPARETLKTSQVIEAMGLVLDARLKSALDGLRFTEQGVVRSADANSFDTGLSGLYAGGGMINGGASVSQCVAEGMRAACAIDGFLMPRTKLQ